MPKQGGRALMHAQCTRVKRDREKLEKTWSRVTEHSRAERHTDRQTYSCILQAFAQNKIRQSEWKVKGNTNLVIGKDGYVLEARTPIRVDHNNNNNEREGESRFELHSRWCPPSGGGVQHTPGVWFVCDLYFLNWIPTPALGASKPEKWERVKWKIEQCRMLINQKYNWLGRDTRTRLTFSAWHR